MIKRSWWLLLIVFSAQLINAQEKISKNKDCTITVWMKNPSSKNIIVDITPISLIIHPAIRTQQKMMLDENNKGTLKIPLKQPSIVKLMGVWSDSTVSYVALPGLDLLTHLDGSREDTTKYNDAGSTENDFYDYALDKSREILKAIPQQDPELFLTSWERELKSMQELIASKSSPGYATWISQSIQSLFQSNLCRQLMTYVSMTRQWPVNFKDYTNKVNSFTTAQFNQPDLFTRETDKELAESYYLFYSLMQDKKNNLPAPSAEATYRNAINLAKNIKAESSRNIMLNYLVTSAAYHTTDTSFLNWMKKAIVTDKQTVHLGKLITEKQELLQKIGTNKRAPDFEATDFSGNKFSYKNFEGKYLFIDIWATWCIPCRKEIPYLEQLKKKYAGQSVEFISVSIDKNFGAWKKFVESTESKNQFHSLQDNASRINEVYNANKIPAFVLIDPQGRIVNPSTYRPSDPELGFLLDELLQKK